MRHNVKRSLSEGTVARKAVTLIVVVATVVEMILVVVVFIFGTIFLDASSYLYKRAYPSVGPSVRRSVGPSRFRKKVENGHNRLK